MLLLSQTERSLESCRRALHKQAHTVRELTFVGLRLMVCFMRCKTASMASDGLTVDSLASEFERHQWKMVMRHPVGFTSRLVLQMAVWAEEVSAGAAFCQALESLVPGLLQFKTKAWLPKTKRLQFELPGYLVRSGRSLERGTTGCGRIAAQATGLGYIVWTGPGPVTLGT